MKMNSASQDKKFNDIGANIFIGNLAEEVDEKLLYDTFSAFGGMLTTPKIMRDPETGVSKGYGFISYDSFESSDMALECMNGQYLSNRPIGMFDWLDIYYRHAFYINYIYYLVLNFEF